ncbi:protein CHUP1, chloroplastic [Olea europaea var. sylvestris]|uniref:protein CHUP1, chloroplastic n=1 Tax=Olea europaea var. sylvestris TaxID=158386 RepID=UPI000C1CF6F5|nr:protein CHUP1, chloroplastic [Olea europaea var. sylvestris]
MGSSTGKVEAMKPVLVKAGIPLAITVIGFVFAKIAGRKYLASKAPSLSKIQEKSVEIDSREMYRDDDESFHSLDSASLPCVESDHAFTDACYENSIETLQMQEEIYGLRSQIQDLNMQFLRYQNLKEQEMVLLELRNKFLLEIMRVEYFTREISLMEAEIQRFEHIVIDYLKIMGLLEFLRSENALLHKRAKKLFRRNREQYHVLKKQNLQIVAKETEISRTRKELEMKDICIKNMEETEFSRARKEQEMKDICTKKMDNEIRELKIASERLQEEKIELLSKLAEKSAASKIEGEEMTLENSNQLATIDEVKSLVQIKGEEMTLENYNQLANEVEQLQKDRAAETRELIYLRWCNACLRHELTRRNTEQDEVMEENDHRVDEIAEYGSDHEIIKKTEPVIVAIPQQLNMSSKTSVVPRSKNIRKD